MSKYAAIALLLCLALFLGYRSFFTEKLTERDVIEKTVLQAKLSNKLTDEQVALLSIQLGVEAYLSKNAGRPPSSLLDLVPDYISYVPENPRTKKPFKYQVSGNNYRLGAEVSFVPEKGDDKSDEENGVDGTESVLASLVAGDKLVNPNKLKKDTFVYDPSQKRDPFMPFDLAPKRAFDNDVPPLQQYELGQLRVTAVIERSGGERSAIVENNIGRGFTVNVGTKIGVNRGEVIAIEKKSIKVLEIEVDFSGQENQNVVEMKIHSSGDGPRKDIRGGTTIYVK